MNHMYPESLKNLIESFKYLPGIGEKTAERLAFSILDLEPEQIELFMNSMGDVSKNIHRCSVCNGLTDLDKCLICSNKNRNEDILCVVEDPKNIFLFEKLDIFKGVYHVLDGLISPLDGINPEDIGISKLVERIHNSSFKEIILAFKPSIEAETTALYIKRILDGSNIPVSKIASGIPMGADMEYIDALTIERAMSDRKDVE